MNSLHFDMIISMGTYLFDVWLRKKVPLAVLNLLLVFILPIITFLLVFKIGHQDYNEGARYLSYFLAPATACLAIPLCKQLELLEHHFAVVVGGIISGVLTNAFSIFALSKLFGLGHKHYMALLPKSITTAIGIGVGEETGGIVTLAMVGIVVTGILGDVIAGVIFRLFKIEEPIVRGLALGTSVHVIGTTRALEVDEIESTMPNLAIAVAGLLTVVVVPLVSGLI